MRELCGKGSGDSRRKRNSWTSFDGITSPTQSKSREGGTSKRSKLSGLPSSNRQKSPSATSTRKQQMPISEERRTRIRQQRKMLLRSDTCLALSPKTSWKYFHLWGRRKFGNRLDLRVKARSNQESSPCHMLCNSEIAVMPRLQDAIAPRTTFRQHKAKCFGKGSRQWIEWQRRCSRR